jgi:hypothetical protein
MGAPFCRVLVTYGLFCRRRGRTGCRRGHLAWFILDVVAQRGSTTNKFGVPNGFEHRFEQQARSCVHTVPRPTNFDLPVSDG